MLPSLRRVSPALCNLTVWVGVESAGLLYQPARASPAYEAKLGPASAGLFLRAASYFQHRNQRLGWPLDWAKFAEP